MRAVHKPKLHYKQTAKATLWPWEKIKQKRSFGLQHYSYKQVLRNTALLIAKSLGTIKE
jgi:hypothetical protein